MSQPQAEIPQRIGPFRVLSVLGKGGMGVVLKAQQEGLDRTVALKVLAPHIAHDATYIERFQREARVSARLNHPNVVQGIDVGRDPTSGLWYFAMEFIEGTTAGAVLKERGALPERDALKIAREVALALACAEANSIVHRDIKPDNILLDAQGTAKLADLGLARKVQDDASLTQSGQTVGTPYYMAPEQVEGRSEAIDIRSDIYALGATLFHFVTGRPPFQGPSPTVIMAKHLSDDPPLADRIAPEVSPACANLIAGMLEKAPSRRPQHPDEVAAEIDELLRNPVASTRAARSIAPLTTRTGRRPSESTSRLAPVRGATTSLGSMGNARAGTASRRRNSGSGVTFFGFGVAAILLLAAWLLMGGPAKPTPMGPPPNGGLADSDAESQSEPKSVGIPLPGGNMTAKTEPVVAPKSNPMGASKTEASAESQRPVPSKLPESAALPSDAKPAEEKLEVPADAITWSNGGGDGRWTNPENWASGKVPGATESAVFNESSGADCLLDGNIKVKGVYLGNGYGGTLRLAERAELQVLLGGLHVYGGRFDGGRGRVRSDGGLVQKGGAFGVPALGLAVRQVLTIRGGTFVPGGGPLEIIEKATVIDVLETHFGEVTIDTGGNITIKGVMYVDKTFHFICANTILEGTIRVAGDVITERSKPLSAPTGTVCLAGAGDQRIVSKTTPGYLPSVQIDKPSGKVHLDGELCVQAQWQVLNGAVDAGQSSVWIGQGKARLQPGAMTFNHLGLETLGNVLVEGTVKVRGNFTVKAANSISGGEILVGGKISFPPKKPEYKTPVIPWKEAPMPP